jgi:DNA-binding FadR family transcriptional regulator
MLQAWLTHAHSWPKRKLSDNMNQSKQYQSLAQSTEVKRLYAVVARRIAAFVAEQDMKPGDRLPSEHKLALQFNISRATVREAIVALEVLGLVDVRVNCGAVILDPHASTTLDQGGGLSAGVSGEGLEEVARFRILLETDGARQSIANGGVDWESALVAAHHRLAHIEFRMKSGSVTNYELWRQCDWEFHEALVAGCGSTLHKRLHKAAFDQFRKVVALEYRAVGFRGLRIIEEHKAILDAALARDSEACAVALERHITAFFSAAKRAAPVKQAAAS